MEPSTPTPRPPRKAQPQSQVRPRQGPQAGGSGLGVLMASSEAHPLIKTGGLADVAASLPAALVELGHDARLIIPAYPRAVKQVRELKTLCEIRVQGSHEGVRILGGNLPDTWLPVYLVEAPDHFCREGSPYTDLSGRDWGDNAERFALFSRVVARIALGLPALGWRPQILHCNDWQTGLAPALLSDHADRPATVFTVHNLAYQGLFDRATFDRLGLAPGLWAVNGLEFHQRMSFIKGGLVFSDLVNTVSPTYAEEVRMPRFGCGLDGLLRQLGGRFRGILNGIDYYAWDPQIDPLIPQPYARESVHLKVENKLELQREFRLPRNERAPLFGYIGRLVEQKGVDMILDILPRLMDRQEVQVILQTAGDLRLERVLRDIAAANPERIAVHTAYDEPRAHRIEAGCDAFLMPSRFEPCGLNQMYSLRYGTLPVVHRTGGLADTVVHASPEALADGSATGFLFDEPTAESLWGAVQQALALYRDRPDLWRAMALTGMAQDFSWQHSAREYEGLYQEAMDRRQQDAPAA
jgi:starch synthase